MLSRIFDWARGKGQRARGIGHGAWGTRGSRGGGEKTCTTTLPISPSPLLPCSFYSPLSLFSRQIYFSDSHKISTNE